MLTIPNIESAPTFDGQSVSDATDWAAQSASETGTGVISGMTVVALGTNTMGASVTSGTYGIGGVAYTYSGGSVVVTSASVSDRRDIVTIGPGPTTASVTAGTPCGTAGWTRNSAGLPPVKPATPGSSCLLGEIYVASTTASVAAGNLIDKTTTIFPVGLQMATFTASVNTWTVPAGVSLIELFLVGPGGGGGSGFTTAADGSGGGGGGGQVVPWVPVTVSPGQVLTIQLGLAGNGGSAGAGGTGTAASVTGSNPTVSVVANGGVGGAVGAAAAGGIGGNYGGGAGGGRPNATTQTEPGFGQFGGGGMGGLSTTVAGGYGGAEPYFGYGGGGGGGAESGGTAGVGGGTSGGSGVVAGNGNAGATNTGGGGGGGASFVTTGKLGGKGGTGYCAIQWIG